MAELSGPVTEDHGDTLRGVRAHIKFFLYFLDDDSTNGDRFRVADQWRVITVRSNRARSPAPARIASYRKWAKIITGFHKSGVILGDVCHH